MKLYHIRQTPDEALYSEIAFDSTYTKYLSGSITEKGNLQREKDAALGAEVSFFTDSVAWQQKVKVRSTDSVVLKGSLRYIVKSGDEFLNGEDAFYFFYSERKACINCCRC